MTTLTTTLKMVMILGLAVMTTLMKLHIKVIRHGIFVV